MEKKPYKPFTRTEMKMLVYNKVKSGMDYNSAVKQLEEEIKEMEKIEIATKRGDKQQHTAYAKPTLSPGSI